MRRFTDQYIKSLKPTDKRKDYLESEGFTMRVTPTGKKLWYYTYQHNGNRKALKLGEYPATPLVTARKRHREAVNMRLDGVDPAQRKQEAKRSSFGSLCELYLKQRGSKKKDGGKEDRRIFEADALPYLKHRPASEVTRSEIADVVNRVLARGADRAANILLARLKTLYNFALDTGFGHVQVSPCHRMKPPGVEKPRSRVLTDDEIKYLFSRKSQSAYIMQLSLLTGQRVGECMQIVPEQIKDNWWTIPADVAKNGIEHRVYLSPPALSVSLQITKPPKDVSAVGMTARRWQKGFTPHDCRRTAATRLAGMGYSDEMIDRLLNHKRPLLSRTYNLHKYDAEKREMAIMLALMVRKIIRKKDA